MFSTIISLQSFGGASSSSSLSHLRLSDVSTSSFLPRSNVTTTSSHTSSKQHAKVSPYMPKQEMHAVAERLRCRSPKIEKLTPFELELSSAAAQGKLAYVSPTVRALPTAAAAKISMNVTGGNLSNGTQGLTAASHLSGRGNMRLCVQQAGGSGMSQLSPVQLSQPVLLNTDLSHG